MGRSNKKEEVIVKEIKEEKKENKNIKIYMLAVQFFLSIITLIFVVLFLFKKNVLACLQISLALTLIVIGINNIIVYKRKILSAVYFLIGAGLITLAVITILGI